MISATRLAPTLPALNASHSAVPCSSAKAYARSLLLAAIALVPNPILQLVACDHELRRGHVLEAFELKVLAQHLLASCRHAGLRYEAAQLFNLSISNCLLHAFLELCFEQAVFSSCLVLS